MINWRGFDAVSGKKDERASGQLEILLLEILRRGGKQWEPILLEASQRTESSAGLPKDFPHHNTGHGIIRLTALRRLQHLSDPLPIELDEKQSFERTYPDLPIVNAFLINRDSEKFPIELLRGGDDRSGRRDRWRFEVKDSQGRVLPVKERFGLMGGGLGGYETLQFGDKYAITLAMLNYLDPLQPGKYTVRILYHEKIDLARLHSIDGLICCESQPFTLIIKPIVVHDKVQTRRQVTSLVSAIEKEKGLKIVAGTYDQGAYRFVPPWSPQGRLLLMRHEAIVPLLGELKQPDLSVRRREVILSLLYSLTGKHCPYDGFSPDVERGVAGIVGPYQVQLGRWNVSGEGGGTYWVNDYPGEYKSEIDPAAQKKFAERWEDFRKYLQVEH